MTATRTPSTVPPTPPNTFPPGWVVEPQPNGSVRLYLMNGAKSEVTNGAGMLAFCWLVTSVPLLGFGYTELSTTNFLTLNMGLQFLVTLSLFAGGLLFPLIGIGYISDFLWGRYGTEEWWASHHRLERRTGWRFSKRCKKRDYTHGVWVVRQRPAEYQNRWDLILDKQQGKFYDLPIWQTKSDFNSNLPEQLRALAQVFSEATGWPLEFKSIGI